MGLIKILPRHTPSYGSLIDYILRDGANKEPQIITHNLHSIDPELATQEFILNESYRAHPRANQTYLTHEILSFSKEDAEKMTPEIMQDIATKYIALRAKDAVVFGSVHRDTDSVHWHFAISGTALYTGKAMRVSHAELRDIKTSLQEWYIEKYPHLQKSLCKHGKGKEYTKTKEWYKEKRENIEGNVKQTVKYCLEMANSRNDFIELLKLNGVFHYERKAGDLSGVIVNCTKFRFNGLDIDMQKLNSLPSDQKEEMEALLEIQALRDQRESNFQNRLFQFEETVGNKDSLIVKGSKDWMNSELSPSQKQRFETVNEVLNESPERFDPDDSEPDIDPNDENDFSEDDDDEELDEDLDMDSDMDMDDDFGR